MISNNKDGFSANISKSKLKEIITKRVYDFCKKYKMNNSKTIYKFAELIMRNDDSNKWENVLIKNPYILMNMSGVGFTRADSIAMKINFPRDHKYRILAFVSKTLDDLSRGSTIIPLGEIFTYMSDKLDINNKSKIIDTVLNHSDGTYKMLDDKCKTTDDILNARFLTKTIWYETERDWYKLCVKVSKMDKLDIDENVIDNIISKYSFKLNEGQNKAIRNFYKHGLNILTGWGGTGKTFTTRTILDILKSMNQTYTCLTPTGISSKVFTSSTNISSQTIHRKYYTDAQIETDWLILDECSMHSIEHISMILKMIDIDNPPRLLMIGDISQLTPISVGDPFYSIIKLIEKRKIKGSVTHLTEIMRASNELFIPHLCKMFVGNNAYDNSVENKKDLAGVEFIPLEGNLSDQILNIIRENNFNFDNTMVLIPQNIGEVGNNAINSYLDNVSAGTPLLEDKYKAFRKGSYCMNIKNNTDLNIFNGERIKLIDRDNDKFICKKLDDSSSVEYDEESFKENVQLSYSVTIHKCQGITMDNIIFVASNKYSHMNTRELVYTGLSRASKKLIILYEKGALSNASKKIALDKRNTFLRKLGEL